MNTHYNTNITSGSINNNNNNLNLVNQSVVEMISPEMLSNEETINLMVDILRRVIKSAEMSRNLYANDEFKTLVSIISDQ